MTHWGIIMKRLLSLAVPTLLLVVSGLVYAAGPSHTAFLEGKIAFEKDPDRDGAFRFTKKGVDLGNYDRIAIAPIARFNPLPNDNPSASRMNLCWVTCSIRFLTRVVMRISSAWSAGKELFIAESSRSGGLTVVAVRCCSLLRAARNTEQNPILEAVRCRYLTASDNVAPSVGVIGTRVEFAFCRSRAGCT